MSTTTYLNRVRSLITNAPGTSGALVLGAAYSTQHITLSAAHDGMKFTVSVEQPGVGAEERRDCVYTHSTRILTRGTLESSTTGSPIDLTSAAVVSVVVTSADLQRVTDSSPTGTITDAQAQAGIPAGGYVGEIRTLSDGPNAGTQVRWYQPTGAPSPAWCWHIYPQAIYQG